MLNPAALNLLYFARLREAFGRDRETVVMPEPATVDGLLAMLQGRGGVWADELSAGRNFRVAVNQTVSGRDQPLRGGDEVAIFPPVTGG